MRIIQKYTGGNARRSVVKSSLIQGLLCASLSLLFIAASCQAPLKPTQTGDFSVLKSDNANPASQRKSLVPDEILYIHGDPDELFPDGIPADLAKLPRHVEKPGFSTQALPINTACNSNCGVTAMTASASWPQPGYGPSGANLSLGQATSYVYGIQVITKGTNASGQSIATEIWFTFSTQIARDLTYPILNASVAVGPVKMISTDGLHFTLSSSTLGYRSISFNYHGTPARPDGSLCHSSMGTSGSQSATVASLTLNPATSNASLPTYGSAIVNIATSGPGKISWGALNCFAEPDYTRGLDVPGTFSSSASLNVGVYFSAPLPLATPTPTSTPTPTPLPTSTPTPTPLPTSTPTPLPSSTPTPFPTSTPTPTPTISPELDFCDPQTEQILRELLREAETLTGGFNTQAFNSSNEFSVQNLQDDFYQYLRSYFPKVNALADGAEITIERSIEERQNYINNIVDYENQIDDLLTEIEDIIDSKANNKHDQLQPLHDKIRKLKKEIKFAEEEIKIRDQRILEKQRVLDLRTVLARVLEQLDGMLRPPSCKKIPADTIADSLTNYANHTIEDLETWIKNITDDRLKNDLRGSRDRIYSALDNYYRHPETGKKTLFGEIAEAKVALALKANNENVIRIGARDQWGVSDLTQNPTHTDLDFIVGEPGHYTIGEVKTGDNIKKSAVDKFTVGVQNANMTTNVDRFVYVVDEDPITPEIKSTLTREAKKAGFANFDPNNDIRTLKSVVPDIGTIK